jgi:hypothetical protein
LVSPRWCWTLLDYSRVERRLAHGAGSCVFAHLDRIDHRNRAEAGATLEVTALSLEHPRLHRLLGETTACDLLATLELAAAPAARARPCPSTSRPCWNPPCPMP